MHLEFEPWLSGSCRGCRGSVELSELSCCRNCRAVVDSMTAHTHGHCRNCRSLVCRGLSGPVGAVGLSGCRAVGTVVVLSGNCKKKLSYCRTGAQSYQYNTDQKDTLVCTDRAVSRPSQIPYDLPYTDSAERERESEGPRGQKANRQTRTGCKERTSTRRTLSLRGTHKDEDAGGNRDTETETRGGSRHRRRAGLRHAGGGLACRWCRLPRGLLLLLWPRCGEHLFLGDPDRLHFPRRRLDHLRVNLVRVREETHLRHTIDSELGADLRRHRHAPVHPECLRDLAGRQRRAVRARRRRAGYGQEQQRLCPR